MTVSSLHLPVSPKVLLILLITALQGCNQMDPHERSNTYDPLGPHFKPESPDSLAVRIQENRVSLSWEDQSDHEEGYHIERSLGQFPDFETLEKLPPNTESFTDVIEGEPFWVRYRVTPYVEDGFGREGRSRTTSNLPFIPFNKVQPDLQMLSETRIRINWPLMYESEVQYQIIRSGTPIDTVNYETGTYVDSLASHSISSRNYTIRPLTKFEYGPYSQNESIGTNLGQPRNFALSKATEEHQITLSWEPTPNYPEMIEGYHLEFRPDGESWRSLATLDSDARHYVFNGMDRRQTFSFRVRTITSRYATLENLSYDSTFVRLKYREVPEGNVHRVALNNAEDIIYFASGHYTDAKLVAWDWKQNQDLFSIDRETSVQDIQITPDDSRLIVATGSIHTGGGNLQVINGRTGVAGPVLVDGRAWLTAISPDGQHYLSIRNGIEIRDINDNSLVNEYSLETTSGGIKGAAFHPTAPYIAFRSRGGNLEIHHLHTKERSSTAGAGMIEYDSNGENLFDGVQMRDPITGVVKERITTHGDDYNKITLGPYNQLYAVWRIRSHRFGIPHRDGLKVFDIEGNRQLKLETFKGPIKQIAGSEEGKYVVTISDGGVGVWTLGRQWQPSSTDGLE